MAVLKLLIEAGAKVLEGDEHGITLLIIAAEKENHAVVAALLAGGADVKRAADSGYTAVLTATQVGQRAVGDCVS
jgi:ankyrin repeat protein